MSYLFLDTPQQEFLYRLDKLFLQEKGFCLFGGTALAFYYEHRESEDFDFMTNQIFESDTIINKMLQKFPDITVHMMQKNTIDMRWNGVKVSFFGGDPYMKISPIQKFAGLDLYSKPDIMAMKIAAILKRNTLRDYFDLAYAIRAEYSVQDILEFFRDRFQEKACPFPDELIYKILLYTDDIPADTIDVLQEKEYWGADMNFTLKRTTEIFLNQIKG